MILPLRRSIIAFATLMGTVGFYILLLATIVASSVVVVVLGQGSPAAVGIIFAMSAFSLIQCGAILVAQHEDEKRAHHRDDALHVKVDSLLRGVEKADNRLIGIEQDVEEGALPP